MKKVKIITSIDGVETEKNEFNIYLFNELSDSAKENAINDHAETLEIVHGDILESFINDELKDYGLDIDETAGDEISYDFSYGYEDHFWFHYMDLINYYNMRDYNNNKTEKNYNKLNVFEKYIFDNYQDDFIKALIEILNSGEFFDKTKDGIITRYDEYKNIGAVDFKDFTSDLYNNVYIKICKELKDFGYSFLYPDRDDVIYDLTDREIYFKQDGSYYDEF